MKNLSLKWGAAIALSLFMAAWSPLGTAQLFVVTPCNQLAAAVLSYNNGDITENPLKPTNVEATDNTGALSFTLSWDVSSYRPADTVTGWCAHFTHESSGATRETCAQNSHSSSVVHCATAKYCTGTFDIKVKLQNNCGLTDEYSDTISYKHVASSSTSTGVH